MVKLSERCWIGPLALVSWVAIILLVCLPSKCHSAEHKPALFFRAAYPPP